MQVVKAEESTTAKFPIRLSAAAFAGQWEMGLLKAVILPEQDSFSLSGTAEIFTFAAIHHRN